MKWLKFIFIVTEIKNRSHALISFINLFIDIFMYLLIQVAFHYFISLILILVWVILL